VNGFENRERLLRDAQTGEPILPRIQPGYYPGYSTLSQQGFWDAATRETVLSRLEPPPKIRFFSCEEVRLLECICDHILPQDDRDLTHRIPIVPFIDDRLYEKRIPGYRFASMPPDGEAYQLGLRAINSMAKTLFSLEFLEMVDCFGRTHDIANLFICDGSVLPTQGSANPGLTIQALAARTADYLISQAEQIFNSDRRDLTAPPIRRHLSPPGTHGRGVPRPRVLARRLSEKVRLTRSRKAIIS
jgi:hypothetical protein